MKKALIGVILSLMLLTSVGCGKENSDFNMGTVGGVVGGIADALQNQDANLTEENKAALEVLKKQGTKDSFGLHEELSASLLGIMQSTEDASFIRTLEKNCTYYADYYYDTKKNELIMHSVEDYHNVFNSQEIASKYEMYVRYNAKETVWYISSDLYRDNVEWTKTTYGGVNMKFYADKYSGNYPMHVSKLSNYLLTDTTDGVDTVTADYSDIRGIPGYGVVLDASHEGVNEVPLIQTVKKDADGNTLSVSYDLKEVYKQNLNVPSAYEGFTSKNVNINDLHVTMNGFGKIEPIVIPEEIIANAKTAK